MNRRAAIWIVLPLIAGLFGFGLYRLFELRFASGDVYPPYSTLRADPLGARALFESLELLHDLRATRLYEDLDKVPTGADTTLFVLGLDSRFNEVSESDARELERLARDGGRIVFTFFPETGKPFEQQWHEKREAERQAEKDKEPAKKSPPSRRKRFRKSTDDEPEQKSGAKKEPGADSAEAREQGATNRTDQAGGTAKAKKKKKPPAKDDEFRDFKTVSLRERWGYGVDYQVLKADERGVARHVTVTRAGDDARLPAQLDWHSATLFKTTNAAWRVLYAREDQPVVIERAFGRGSLVLVSDSFFASNEAMRHDRQSALLAWLAGPSRRLVFDETHLGVELNPGIATLARRYRLHGLFASLLLLAVLFVWKNSTSLVPPHDEAAVADAVAGKDSAAGFVNLLRRSVAPRELLPACLAEWRKSGAHGRADPGGKAARLAAVIESGKAKPVDAYREASRILTEKKL
ncbi:MAG: DUF4350 domain-containing protein [Verrucomicrobia bacterium]|nr:DUF4350 domain-containing protein [Verrucomicrobiota bacterium]